MVEKQGGQWGMGNPRGIVGKWWKNGGETRCWMLVA